MRETPMAFLIASILVFFGTAAFAGSYHHGHGCGMTSWDLNEIDENQDGELSFEEFSAPQQKRLKAGYDMIDTDKDGLVSTEEWDAFRAVHGMEKSG
jgi:hypothetical protein